MAGQETIATNAPVIGQGKIVIFVTHNSRVTSAWNVTMDGQEKNVMYAP